MKVAPKYCDSPAFVCDIYNHGTYIHDLWILRGPKLTEIHQVLVFALRIPSKVLPCQNFTLYGYGHVYTIKCLVIELLIQGWVRILNYFETYSSHKFKI